MIVTGTVICGGHGLVRTTAGLCELPLSAYRIRTPSMVRKRTCGLAVVGMRQSSRFAPSFEAANPWPSPWSVLGWQGGGEKVGEQLGDALSLVVVDPVRGVGQALDAVEVRYVVVVGFG